MMVDGGWVMKRYNNNNKRPQYLYYSDYSGSSMNNGRAVMSRAPEQLRYPPIPITPTPVCSRVGNRIEANTTMMLGGGDVA
jgi:hypothetical protein